MSRKKKRKAKTASQKRKSFHPRLEEHAKTSGFQSYGSYLNSVEWAKKRLEALERDKGCCAQCGGEAKLQVHHLRYETLGEEKLDSLETLCKNCHERQHNRKKSKGRKKRKNHRPPKRQRRRKPPAAETPKEKGLVPRWEK